MMTKTLLKSEYHSFRAYIARRSEGIRKRMIWRPCEHPQSSLLNIIREDFSFIINI